MRLGHARDVEIPLVAWLHVRGDAFNSSATKFLLVRGEVFYSFAARPSTRPRRGLLLGRDDVFYSSAERPPTRP